MWSSDLTDIYSRLFLYFFPNIYDPPRHSTTAQHDYPIADNKSINSRHYAPLLLVKCNSQERDKG